MYKELNVRTISSDYKIFLQSGFYPKVKEKAPLHSHGYGEIHLISGGIAKYMVDNDVFELCDGDAIFIPQGVFHCCTEREQAAYRTAFQVSMEDKNIKVIKLPPDTVRSFLEEIEKSTVTKSGAVIGAYIAFFCCLFEKSDISVKNVTDPGFIIHEFFANKYSEDIHLSDLAQLLHLSGRQTERLVKLHTGRSFRDELSHVRISLAKRLIATSAMPLCDIAAYVGFNSYAGFYKAMKKYDT